MVKIGKFTVEIILADTETAFKEHTGPDGTVYAEVEPDCEYFIRVKTEHADSGPGTIVIAMFTVDKECLGYESYMRCGQEATKGLWSRINGKEMKKAFRFQKASVMDCAADADGKPWTGCVEVKFYEARNGHIIEQENCESKWKGGKVGTLLGQEGKKGVKSIAGATSEITEGAKRRKITRYSKGECLATISLYYCTTVGLIYADVLPQPPAWDLHRLTFPRNEAEEAEIRRARMERNAVEIA
jgi:hypothetical protein